MKKQSCKKIALILSCMLLLSLALSGCGKTEPPAATAAPTEPPAQASGSAAAETPAAAEEAVEPMVITTSYTYNESDLMGQMYLNFQNKVTELSGGAITFDTYWSGSLISADDVLESMSAGICDMGNGLPVRTTSLTPLGGMSFYFPFRTTDMTVAYNAAKKIIADVPEITREIEAQGLELVAIVPTGAMELISTKPVQSYKDLAGLKVASAGPDYKVWESAGAAVVSVSGAERYENLQRSVIDASYLDLSSSYGTSCYEVAKYITITGLGCLTTVQFWADQDFWAGLSDTVKGWIATALDEAVGEYIDQYDAYVADALKDMQDNYGVTVYQLSDEDKAEWAAKMENLPQQYAETLIDTYGYTNGYEIVENYIRYMADGGHHWVVDWTQGWK